MMGDVRQEQMHFLGASPQTQRPVLIPIDAFTELAWFAGPMGSGKTVALIQLAERLIELGYSVLYVDLKGGSREIAESLRLAAVARGVPMKLFSNSPGDATHAANPFWMRFWSRLSLQQRVYFLLRILGVEHDLAEFGQGFFTTASGEVTRHSVMQRPSLKNFRDLSHTLMHVFEIAPASIPRELLRHGAHVLGAVNRLAELDALNVGTSDELPPEVLDQQIDFENPFVRQEVHYYHLPATRGGTLSGEVAGYVLHSLGAAAEQLRHRKQVFLFVDEHQVMATAALNTCLAQFRSLNVGVILANQTPSQIKDSTVLGNLVDGARFRQWFGLGLDSQLWFEARSGKRIEQFETRTMGQSSHDSSMSISLAETLVPHISVNSAKRVTAETSLSFYELVRGTEHVPSNGFAGVVQSSYNCSYAEYQRRKAADWPKLPGTFRQHLPDEGDPDAFPRRPRRPELEDDY